LEIPYGPGTILHPAEAIPASQRGTREAGGPRSKGTRTGSEKALNSAMQGLHLFRCRGIAIRLHFSWFPAVLLLTWSLATDIFPDLFPDLPGPRAFGLGFCGALLFFFCLLLHEAGHCLISVRCGIPVHSITLSCMGGVAEIAHEPRSPRDEVWIALAGPLVSLGLGLAFLALAFLFDARQALFPALLAAWLGWANLFLLLFNLLPGYPLDGGRVLRSLLWARSGQIDTATRISARIGSFLGIAIAGYGLWCMVFLGQAHGAGPILVGLFLRHTARKSIRRLCRNGV
jgi:Zn-dependent protease